MDDTRIDPTPTITTFDSGVVSLLTETMKVAFDKALSGAPIFNARVYDVEGFCGRKHRAFINLLIQMVEDARYLEVGVFRGATLCAAVSGNKVRALGVDNWSEYGGKANEFYANLAQIKDVQSSVSILEQDFRTVPYDHIGKFNVYFYDGPHSYEDQYDGVLLALPALDDLAVLIVDDWNWERVREGTFNALADSGATIDYGIELRTSMDESIPSFAHRESHWHNGICAFVIRKAED